MVELFLYDVFVAITSTLSLSSLPSALRDSLRPAVTTLSFAGNHWAFNECSSLSLQLFAFTHRDILNLTRECISLRCSLSLSRMQSLDPRQGGAEQMSFTAAAARKRKATKREL